MTATLHEPVLTMTRNTCRLVLILLLAMMPRGGYAQEGPFGSTRVTLVASGSASRSTRTEVVRRAQRTPQNVVLVDRNATPEDLAGALAMIKALRIQHGDRLQFDFRARPEIIRQRPTWPQSTYRAWLIEQLARLRRATPAPLSDLGVVSAVQITLPAGHGSVFSSSSTRP